MDMTTLTRRERKRAETLDELLTIARDIMREEGAGALNLNEMARRAGMKTPSLYEYFPGGKFAVYDALFRLGFRLFGEYVRVVYDLNIQDALRGSIERYFDFAQTYPELFELCFQRPIPGFVPSEAALAESFGLLAESREVFARLLTANNIETGMTVEQAHDLIIAITHGIAALHRANEPHLPRGEGRFGSLIPLATDLLLRQWGLAR
jgi:AcrR family transcriptional regulator